MNTSRRSIIVAAFVVACSGLPVAGLPAQAVPTEQARARTPAPAGDDRPTMAAGVLVRTTTATAGRSLVADAADVLPPGVDVAKVRRSGVGGRTSVIGTSERVTAAEAEVVADELRERDDVVWAVPNYILTVQAEPPVSTNDTAFRKDQVRAVWDRRSRSDARVRAVMGSANRFPKGGYSSKAPYAWRATRGAGQVVAVLDTGMTDHPDLPTWNGGRPRGRMLPGYDFVSRYTEPGFVEDTGRDGDGWDPDASDDGDWIPAEDYCGYKGPAVASSWHGTHVAGIIGAASNNQGIVGVAPQVDILPVRVLGLCGGTTEDIVTGIRWAAGLPVTNPLTGDAVPANPRPADVINLSLAGYATEVDGRPHSCTTTYAGPYVEAIAAVRARGAVVVAAAGNEGSNISSPPTIPATCAGVIAVAATSEYGDRAGYRDDSTRKSIYSNYGSLVDLSAPGGDAYWDGRGIKSTVNAGTRRPTTPTYKEYIGTSMAAPVVAAGAALVRSLGAFTAAQTEKALESAVQSFPASGRSSQFKPCSTSRCGAGILSLSKLPAPIRRVTISGEVGVGSRLTASPGWWNAKPSTFTYVWQRNGLTIPGATAATYTPAASDVGARLSVRVAPAASAFAPISSTSAQTVAVPAR